LAGLAAAAGIFFLRCIHDSTRVSIAPEAVRRKR
jgi:hypothetical protein